MQASAHPPGRPRQQDQAGGRTSIIENIKCNAYSNVNSDWRDVEISDMPTMQAHLPRAVKATPEPLGSYLRPSLVNHRGIAARR